MADPRISLSTRVKPQAQMASSKNSVKNWEKWVLTGLGAGAVAALLFAIVGWYNSPSSTPSTQTAQVSQRSTLTCDGNWHPVTLTTVPQLTTGRDGDKVTVNVDQGGVVLISKDGKEAPFVITPGDERAYNFAAAKWRASGQVAYANAMCPRR